MSFLSGWLRVGQDGCWLAGPWAGLLAGWLLGGLLLAGWLGGWPAGLWSRLGWLSWSGLGWLAAAGGRAGWLQRLTGKRPAASRLVANPFHATPVRLKCYTPLGIHTWDE